METINPIEGTAPIGPFSDAMPIMPYLPLITVEVADPEFTSLEPYDEEYDCMLKSLGYDAEMRMLTLTLEHTGPQDAPLSFYFDPHDSDVVPVQHEVHVHVLKLDFLGDADHRQTVTVTFDLNAPQYQPYQLLAGTVLFIATAAGTPNSILFDPHAL